MQSGIITFTVIKKKRTTCPYFRCLWVLCVKDCTCKRSWLCLNKMHLIHIHCWKKLCQSLQNKLQLWSTINLFIYEWKITHSPLSYCTVTSSCFFDLWTFTFNIAVCSFFCTFITLLQLPLTNCGANLQCHFVAFLILMYASSGMIQSDDL